MQTIAKKKIKLNQLPLNWTQEREGFTGDHLIDAYLKGKQDGKNELINILSKQFEINMVIATSVAENYLQRLKRKKLS